MKTEWRQNEDRMKTEWRQTCLKVVSERNRRVFGILSNNNHIEAEVMDEPWRSTGSGWAAGGRVLSLVWGCVFVDEGVRCRGEHVDSRSHRAINKAPAVWCNFLFRSDLAAGCRGKPTMSRTRHRRLFALIRLEVDPVCYHGNVSGHEDFNRVTERLLHVTELRSTWTFLTLSKWTWSVRPSVPTRLTYQRHVLSQGESNCPPGHVCSRRSSLR